MAPNSDTEIQIKAFPDDANGDMPPKYNETVYNSAEDKDEKAETEAEKEKKKKKWKEKFAKKKKQMKGEDDEDEDDEEAEKRKRLELPPVSMFKLFRFATKQDLALIFVGCLAAVVAGVMMPLMIVLFGDVTNAFVINDATVPPEEAFCTNLANNTQCCTIDNGTYT